MVRGRSASAGSARGAEYHRREFAGSMVGAFSRVDVSVGSVGRAAIGERHPTNRGVRRVCPSTQFTEPADFKALGVFFGNLRSHPSVVDAPVLERRRVACRSRVYLGGVWVRERGSPAGDFDVRSWVSATCPTLLLVVGLVGKPLVGVVGHALVD